MHLLSIPMFTFLLLFTFSLQEIQAHCARCTKIETEREREQAEHPQKMGYYDDTIQLHEKGSQNTETFKNSQGHEREENQLHQEKREASPTESQQ